MNPEKVHKNSKYNSVLRKKNEQFVQMARMRTGINLDIQTDKNLTHKRNLEIF